MASELRELLARIEAEFVAAKQGLSGLASGVARHDFIQRKMGEIDKLHEQIEEAVGSQTALALVVNALGVAETKCELARLEERLQTEGYV